MRVVVQPVTSQNPVCDKGWFPYGGSCYKFYNNKWATRKGANDECFSHDASLLRIENQAQLNWIKNTTKQYPSWGYLTGLNDNPVVKANRLGTGVWKWGSYEYADMSLINWAQAPTNDGQAKCASVNIQGKLSDLKCGMRQGYICKYPSTNGCALGWLPGTTACYWFSNATDGSQLKNWTDSKAICEAKAPGAKLMVIADQNDVNFLMNELPYLAKTTRTHYIGLVSKTVGQWTWYTGDAFNPSLVKWQKEPDNVAGMENCGILRYNGQFSDRDCNLYSNFICYKPQYNSNPTDNLGCGNWIRGGHLCYGFMSNGMKRNWADARSYCQSLGADLVKMDSIDKTTWLNQQLQDPANDKAFWTGFNDQQNEGSYVWADGTPVNTSLINWNSEPNNYMGNEDCALILSTGQYNDVSCYTQAAAICELDNYSPCPGGWVSNQGNCYLFTPYSNTSKLYNQPEAGTYCSTFAPNSQTIGKLLSVDSQSEKTFIKAQVKTMNDNVNGWYTSLNDQASEGYWQFGNKPLLDNTLVDWNGEPSTAPGDNCGLVAYAGLLHVRNCNITIPFICERYATGVSAGNGIKGSLAGTIILLVLAFISKY
ncbi:chromatin-modulating protein mrc1 [Mactra antiquata]